MPVHAAQSASQVAQVASLVRAAGGGLVLARAAGRAAATRGVGRAAAGGGPVLPGAQVEQVLQMVSCVGGARRHLELARGRSSSTRRTHLPTGGIRERTPAGRGARARGAARGQAAQVASAVAVQAAVWYWPAAQVVQALQTTPVPVKPGLHAQVKLPATLVQLAFAEQLSVSVAHSSMSVQPRAAAGEARRAIAAGERAGVLLQIASGSQPPLLVAHSSMSAQVAPSPVKPVLHVQVRVPVVFEHVASARSRRCWSRTRRCRRRWCRAGEAGLARAGAAAAVLLQAASGRSRRWRSRTRRCRCR